MSSETRYHATCYKSCVRISYDAKNDEAHSTSATESNCSKLQLQSLTNTGQTEDNNI